MTVTVGRYLAYDEGCYECGEPSGVLGFYETYEGALAAINKAVKAQNAKWFGQHWMHVIDLSDPEMSEWAPTP